MSEKDEKLLYKDLYNRLPYIDFLVNWNGEDYNIIGVGFGRVTLIKPFMSNVAGVPLIKKVKPYLRPMSSMTEEEKDELRDIIYFGVASDDYDRYGHRGVEVASVKYDDWETLEFDFDDYCKLEDWLNAHHFDYHGLIEKGLALEAPEGMYKVKR